MGVVGGQKEAVNQSMTWFPGEIQRTRVAACEGVSDRRIVKREVCPQDPSVPKNPGVWVLNSERSGLGCWALYMDCKQPLNSHRIALPFILEPWSELAF